MEGICQQTPLSDPRHYNVTTNRYKLNRRRNIKFGVHHCLAEAQGFKEKNELPQTLEAEVNVAWRANCCHAGFPVPKKPKSCGKSSSNFEG